MSDSVQHCLLTKKCLVIWLYHTCPCICSRNQGASINNLKGVIDSPIRYQSFSLVKWTPQLKVVWWLDYAYILHLAWRTENSSVKSQWLMLSWLAYDCMHELMNRNKIYQSFPIHLLCIISAIISLSTSSQPLTSWLLWYNGRNFLIILQVMSHYHKLYALLLLIIDSSLADSSASWDRISHLLKVQLLLKEVAEPKFTMTPRDCYAR